MTTTIFKLYLFILGEGIKPVVKAFSMVFCVPEGGRLFTYTGKEVYIRGLTCVGLRAKMCTFEGKQLP